MGPGGTNSRFQPAALASKSGEGVITFAWPGSSCAQQLGPGLPMWVWLLVPQMSGSGWQRCLAALVCSSSLRTGGKRKEDIQCIDRAKTRCDEASHHTHASLNGKRDGRDSLVEQRVGSRGDFQLKGHRVGTQARAGQGGETRAVCGSVSCCALVSHLSKEHEDGERCIVWLCKG